MAIFNSKTTAPKFFQMGQAVATINNMKAMLIQLTVQFGRQVSPIMTINEGVVFAATPPSGSIEAQSILTKNEDLVTLLEGDSCEALSANVNMSGACDADGIQLNLTGLYFQSINFTLTGQQGYVGEGISGVFSGLEVNRGNTKKLGTE